MQAQSTIADEMIREHIGEQEGEQIADDSRFQSATSEPLDFKSRGSVLVEAADPASAVAVNSS